MAYLVDFNINEYGYLTGGDDFLPRDTARHDWLQPYPDVEKNLNFAWESGDGEGRPQIFAHNMLRDFVCTDDVVQLLSEFAPSDFRVFTHGRLDRKKFLVVQVTSILDVVNQDKSLWGNHLLPYIDFPHIDDPVDENIDRRIFRVPNRGLGLSIFLGDQLQREFESRDISGLTFVSAKVEQ